MVRTAVSHAVTSHVWDGYAGTSGALDTYRQEFPGQQFGATLYTLYSPRIIAANSHDSM